MHRLEEVLGRARVALLQEEDYENGLEQAADILVEGGVVGVQQREAARRALEDAVGLRAWRDRAEGLEEAEEGLDTASSRLSGIGEADLADRVHGLLGEVQDLAPATRTMPQDEVVGMRGLVEVFPGLLLEQLLIEHRRVAEIAEAAG